MRKNFNKLLRGTAPGMAMACLWLATSAASAAPRTDRKEMQLAATVESTSMTPGALSPAQTAPAVSKGYIEVGGERHLLSGGQPDWSGGYLRGAWKQDDKNVWNFEAVRARRFSDNGTFGSLGLTHTFNADWYGSLALGASDGGREYFPRYRIDAFVHRKMLQKKNLVLTAGFTDYKAQTVYRDRILHLGADYYFESPWMVSAEFLANDSTPGNVRANYGYVSASYGRDKDFYLTLRHGDGKEAYQVLGGAQVISDFSSNVSTLTYRKWLTRQWGVNLVGEYYKNPQYNRRGLAVGVFSDF